MIKELSPNLLRRTVNFSVHEDILPHESKAQSIFGQQRAIKALELGLGIRSTGFNIYVSGLPGTGKLTAVKKYLMDLAMTESKPDDWCYVNNFENACEPQKLRLPAGKAKELKEDMRGLIEEAGQALIIAFESEEASDKREEILKKAAERKIEIFDKVERSALAQGFIIKNKPGRVTTIPLKGDKQLSDQEFDALPEKEREEIIEKQEKLLVEIKASLRQERDLDREANAKIRTLEEQIALCAIKILMEELKAKYAAIELVSKYLDAVQKDILDNFNKFIKPQKEQNFAVLMSGWETPFNTRYEVNILVDNSGLEGAPVVIEQNPTYTNLFGKVEKESQLGTLYTDFTLIRKGSLHQANGGYIVIPVEELLRNYLSWDGLKRAIRNKEIVIEEPGERLGFTTTKTLKPEAIPFQARIVLIGGPLLYYLLYECDSEFKELFKVKAEFDSSMDYTDGNVADYISFVGKICQEEKLPVPDQTALAKILEYGCRLAEDQEKLSTRFGELSDIVREASYYAGKDAGKHITSKHVMKAIEEKYYRSSLIQEKITEMIKRGVILIETKGEEVGEITGLAASDFGDVSFGRPTRITATTAVGFEGVVDIERESKLGGKIHTKGVMILSGFLASKFAQKKPLSLSARLVFEQSYSEIEGDSASSTELYALISSLADIPIKQGIAVTGSVNQKGEIQAIGSVNEKIEGFYEVCKQKGLTGTQGVIIPTSNHMNLMLKEEIVNAVAIGKFHVWAVSNIEEGIEILTGREAAKKRKDGTYEEDSIYYKVEQKLKEMAEEVEKRMPKQEMDNYREPIF